MKITIRPAVPADVPALRLLIDASVRGLQAHDYTPAQIDRALESVFGVDSQLIADGTYFVAEIGAAEGRSSQESQKEIAGCELPVEQRGILLALGLALCRGRVAK